MSLILLNHPTPNTIQFRISPVPGATNIVVIFNAAIADYKAKSVLKFSQSVLEIAQPLIAHVSYPICLHS